MVDSWTESTTARERVETIATTLSEPRTTNWIADVPTTDARGIDTEKLAVKIVLANLHRHVIVVLDNPGNDL
jgi:hypothetical protein